jgi:hypothetical protein
LAVAVCSFFPFWTVIRWGHVGLLLAVGIVICISAQRRKLNVAAGLAAVLLTFKPHVLYLLFAALGAAVVRFRLWRCVAAFFFGALVLTAAALAQSPTIFSSWFSALGSSAQSQISATLAGALRLMIYSQTGTVAGWPLWVIPLLGLLGLLVVLAKKGQSAFAIEYLPPLLCLSIFCAPYAWSHDYAALLVVQVGLFAQSAQSFVSPQTRAEIRAELLLLNAACFALGAFAFSSQHQFFWFPLAMLIIWQRGQHLTARDRSRC